MRGAPCPLQLTLIVIFSLLFVVPTASQIPSADGDNARSTIAPTATTIVATATAQQFSSYTDADIFRQSVLNSTNTYRAQHNATVVGWNNTLASFATTVAGTCIFAHSGGVFGENLVAGYSDTTASVDAWGHERTEYNFATPGFTEQTGHFTQLVWKDTTTVGCAVKECNGDYKGEGSPAPGWFLVCEYWPRGNVLGQFAQEVQSQIDDSGGQVGNDDNIQGEGGSDGDRSGDSGSATTVNGGQMGGVVVVGAVMACLFVFGD
ncbi:hypothetical protein FH972_023474 [Carpinus fangiana]|uniref:SCP domain-containing protein n=1 Tax=Carpinus fangiana TaxID=176857 RepID=A0A5N6KVI9_9ROSI|nr:hypothetical protein FH972_023474 [Carpinus fangiana]